MTSETTGTRPAFRDSYPMISDALAEVTAPAAWDGRDEPNVLSVVEELCSWLGPFLPRPEYVALAACDLQGQESDTLTGTPHETPAAILRDLHIVIPYLAMIGAALEVVTGASGE